MPGNAPTAPFPTAEYPLAGAGGELTHHLRLELPTNPYAQRTEMHGHYRDVNVSSREPILRSSEVADFLAGETGMPAVPDYGDQMLEVQLPHGGDLTAPRYQLDRDRVNSSIYVFQKQTSQGPCYTIAGPAALQRAATGAGGTEENNTIITMGPGSGPLFVGTEEGGWMPTVGYDVGLLAGDPELSGTSGNRRTVSSVQGRFYVDEHSDLHYTEHPDRLNSSELYLRKTAAERRGDDEQAARRYAKEHELQKQWANRTQDTAPAVHEIPVHPTVEDIRLEPEDFHHSVISTRTTGGRLVGEKHKGQHRRPGLLGRIAMKLRG